MTENKRLQWVYIKDNSLELRDNGIVKIFNNERLEEFLNELFDENEQLKQDIEYLEEKIKENEWHWNTIDEDRDVWHYKCTEAEKRVEELKEKNKQLKQAYQTLKHRHSLLHDECLETECDRNSLKNDVISLEKENEQLKKEKQGILKRIDDRIAFHSHKPYSTPSGQAMSVNFDEDMDRLARLSELQQLKEELKGDVE